MTKSDKVPILGIFSPKTILMFRVGFKKNREGRPTGTTHTFHLSLPSFLRGAGESCFEFFQKFEQLFLRQMCFCEVQGLTGNLAQTELGSQ